MVSSSVSNSHASKFLFTHIYEVFEKTEGHEKFLLIFLAAVERAELSNSVVNFCLSARFFWTIWATFLKNY